MNDAGSPLFGSSKGRERGSSAFSLLRGRRSGDSDGLISFNLLPQQSENPIPGRVSDTRLLLVHYWRRDQAAQARELSASEAAAALDAALPASAMFVNGAPVTPPTPAPADPFFAAQAPAAAQPVAARPVDEPRPTQAAYADPNRQDFLSSLKSRSRPAQSGSDPAWSGSSSLIIELPASSHQNEKANAASEPVSQSAASALFVEGDAAPAAPPPDRAKSLFEPRPRETAARLETESVFAKVAAAMPPEPTPMPVEDIVAPEPERPVVRALEAFLRRVETRRQQIETESLA